MAEFIRKPGTFTIFKNHNKVEGLINLTIKA